VLKFRGAGQGPKALVAEIVAGELARSLGFAVPELALVELDPTLALAEPDREIQDLLDASAGLNLGVDFLPGALPFGPAAGPPPPPELAADIVWFDALVTNVDRTARNTNLLLWHERLWLIDHGASLYFHHDWPAGLAKSRAPFTPLRDHVLLPFADDLAAVDAELTARLGDDVLTGILDQVPDAWLPEPAGDSRASYVRFLRERLAGPRPFLEAARAGT
jgi:hypothetical protein